MAHPLFETYRAFAAVAARLERAKEDLLRAIPAARAPGVPLAEALLAFRQGLDEAAEEMDGWRDPVVEGEWARCADGVARARAAEERLRLSSPPLAHDALLFAIQDLIAPLEPFEDAARRFEEARAPARRASGRQARTS